MTPKGAGESSTFALMILLNILMVLSWNHLSGWMPNGDLFLNSIIPFIIWDGTLRGFLSPVIYFLLERTDVLIFYSIDYIMRCSSCWYCCPNVLHLASGTLYKLTTVNFRHVTFIVPYLLPLQNYILSSYVIFPCHSQEISPEIFSLSLLMAIWVSFLL